MVFYPKITKGIILNTNEYYPFSWAFFVQCYFRVKFRKDHENLDSSKKKDFYCVLVFFLKFFRNYDFINLKKLSLDRTLEISLCDEKSIKVDDKMINDLHTIFKNLKGQFPKDDDLMRGFINYIETNFKLEDFKDTRELLREELLTCKRIFILVFESYFNDVELQNI